MIPISNHEYTTATLGAAALVTWKGKILLVQMAYGQYAGQWILPGGMVENNEFPHEAARRETAEETGLEVEIKSLFCVRHRFYRNKPANIYWVYRSRLLTSDDHIITKLRWPENEIQEARFWPIADALHDQNIRPMTRLFLRLATDLDERHRYGAIFKPAESSEQDYVYITDGNNY